MGTIWTNNKPVARSGRSGFAYFVLSGDKSVLYCNRIFDSCKHAKNSFNNRLIDKSFKPDDVATIYDVGTDEVVAMCYYKPEGTGYSTVLVKHFQK